MVGAFVQFFFSRVWAVSRSTIFLHGAMELTAIVIAGGSGLMLGSAVLFPGTYSRGYYVVFQARQALKSSWVSAICVLLSSKVMSTRSTRMSWSCLIAIILGIALRVVFALVTEIESVKHPI
jgi:hypothetical protein